MTLQAVQAPLRVDSAEQLQWQQRADLVVVGFGGAGACAAIEAASRGLSVLALERFAGGGATALSGGVVYAGGGTPQQLQAGYTDSSEAMFEYLRKEVGDAVSEQALRTFCDASLEQLAWLERQGAVFEGSMAPHKTSYPSDSYYLYYSGNEAVPAYAVDAAPAPRGHRTKGTGMSGSALFRALADSARRRGVRVHTQCQVRRLVVDREGQILGAEAWQLPAGSRAARQHARLTRWAAAVHMYAPAVSARLRARMHRIEQQHALPLLVRADHGVLLASGGFVFNRQLLGEHAPRYLAGLPLGSSGCDGSGIELGRSVGASLGRMDKVSAWRFINPPMAWAKGMIVNARGERYCNEELYGATLGHAMVEEQDGRALLILDRSLRNQALQQVGPGKVWSFQRLPVLLNLLFNCRRGNTLEQLAQRCRLPVEALRRSIDAYNRAARGELADPHGKSASMLHDLGQGPWYCLDLSYDSRLYPCPTLTLGGLRVCEQSGQVLDPQGQPIAGLYAAGRCAVGVASNLYVSGLSLADCVFSGRRAAAHVAGVAASHRAQQGEQPCNV